MRSVNILFIGLLIFSGTYLFLSVNKSEPLVQDLKIENTVALRVRKQYLQDLTSFEAAISDFKRLVESDTCPEKLIPAFLNLRLSFKKTECLFNYIESNYIRQINGPNLEKAEGAQGPYLRIIEPHGLQLMEEVLYHPEEDFKSQLIYECDHISEILKKIIRHQRDIKINDGRQINIVVWDAIRLELFRIETMGITGFDVPDSKNSIPETSEILTSLNTIIHLFKPIFSKTRQNNLYDRGKQLLLDATNYCRDHNDFDSFDRLTFLKDHLHPLSAWVKQVILNLNYPFPETTRSVNASAEHVFSSDFMNLDVFVKGVSEAKISLGKQLFHDTRLSKDGTRSCATCHDPNKGYTDRMITQITLDGTQYLLRNTPTLWNVIWQRSFFYDSRVNTLEQQINSVIHNPDEMGGNLVLLTSALAEIPSYKKQFDECYNGKISPRNVTNAIACYLSKLTSFNSRFDQYIRGENAQLSEGEKLGFNLFMGKAKCATCHFPPMFNGLVPPLYNETESEIIGVAKAPKQPQIIDKDLGKYNYTKIELHQYAFKTPGLRNIELTQPYMHNGAYETLEDVIEFYNNGGGLGQGMNLDGQTLPPDSLKLTKPEIKALASFMKSLTDESNK